LTVAIFAYHFVDAAASSVGVVAVVVADTTPDDAVKSHYETS